MKRTIKKLLLIFLKKLAKSTVSKFKPTVIAITGSVGKTSTKEAIYAVLSGYRVVRRTALNFNNEMGVPLTILGDWESISKPVFFFWTKVILKSVFVLIFGKKEEYPDVLVLEYGADKQGDISYLLSIAKPHIGIVSAIGTIPVHVENYSQGIESVAKEKGKVITELSPSDFGILNFDDPWTDRIVSKTKSHLLTFGIKEGANVKISRISHILNDGKITGLGFKLEQKGTSFPVVLPDAFSISHAYACACAVAVAEVFDINMVDAAQEFSKKYTPVYGRSLILDGIKNTQIIDESYNSSPLALETTLKTIKNATYARKVAVLGDMLELGEFSIKAHELAGELVRDCIDILITVGPRAKFIAERAIKKGLNKENVFVFDEVKEAGLKLQEIIKEGDLILIKGSRAIGLDSVVDEVRKM